MNSKSKREVLIPLGGGDRWDGMDDDDALIARITALVRSSPPPDERILLKVVSILESGRGEGSAWPSKHLLRRSTSSSTATTNRSRASRSHSQGSGAHSLNHRERQKSKMQPSEARPEHLTLKMGGGDDVRRQRLLALEQRGIKPPVNEREVALRKFQHQMETAPHADAYADDVTQIGGMVVKRPSMTHDLRRFGALSEMEGKLRSGRRPWYDDAPTYEGALDHGPMRF